MNQLDYQLNHLILEAESIDSEIDMIRANIGSLKVQQKQAELKKEMIESQITMINHEKNREKENNKPAEEKAKRSLKTDD